MKRLLVFLLALSLLFLPVSCGKSEKSRASKTYFVMDTFLTITLYEGDDPDALMKKASDMAAEIEKKASRTLPDSEVARFNAAERDYTFSDDMTALLASALRMCEATEGAYDITVAPLVSLWNMKEGGPVPEESAIADRLSYVSYKHLTLEGNTLTKDDPRVAIDLGSAAKGYALGKMASFLEEAGAVGIVNFGGNVALVGEKASGEPWKVSLRDPFSENKTSGTFRLTSGVVAVSGDYERYFEENGVRYHHILSPYDGYPVKGVHSVAVVCEDALEADLLSTALFVMGEKKAYDFYENSAYDFAYVMVLEGGVTAQSPNAEAIYIP